jgi:hypothetical protein
MHRNTKIATCCYCGTRAALVLDSGRHELACAACGAPLRQLKSIPVEPAAGRGTGKPTAAAAPHAGRKKPKREKTRKKRKPRLGKLFKDVLDDLEDLFD